MSRPHSWFAACASRVLAIGSSLLVAGPASAQAVGGVVVDDASSQPVSAATVRLIVGDDLASGQETDQDGRFLLPVPGAGHYRLEVSRLGYTTARSQSIWVDIADTVSVEFYLSPDAILLNPLTVTGRSRSGRHAFRRRMEGWRRGVFLDPATVASIKPKHAAEVLDDVQGIDLRWEWGQNRFGGGELIPSVRSARGRGCLLYLLDGVPVRDDSWYGYQLGMVDGKDVIAVEIYRSVLEVPKELLQHTMALTPEWDPNKVNCGLVVFWTKTGW